MPQTASKSQTSLKISAVTWKISTDLLHLPCLSIFSQNNKQTKKLQNQLIKNIHALKQQQSALYPHVYWTKVLARILSSRHILRISF